MQPLTSVYIEGESFVHRQDPCVKLVILAVYSCALFFVNSWAGMALMTCLFVVALVVARIPLRRVFACGAVIYVLAAFAILFNAVRFDGGQVAFLFSWVETGCFYAARILLLFWMSLLFCFTSSSTALTEGFAKLLRPLQRMRVPVDDIALGLSLALRFIPLTSIEYAQIRQAQKARCAHFDDSTLAQRLQAAGNAFVALFVSLFRRADMLSIALDARCFGLKRSEGGCGRRTSLNSFSPSVADRGVLMAMVLVCAAIAFFL